MKHIYSVLLFFFITVMSAQAPSGYYSTATGSGYTLKTQLYNIIKGHTDQGYSGLWTTYATSDRDRQNENDNTIFDLYSEIQNGPDPYNYTLTTNQCGTYAVEGDCYNREHIIPQSTFNSAAPMVSDAHFIPPTDGKVNGLRSSFPHGNVATASTTTLNGSKLGTSAVSGFTGTVFEPAAAFKGDIARMYFYFATRYENTVAGYPYAMFNGSSNQVFTTAFLNVLLSWHANDPVSSREIERNNAIYARQGNRNPFIDNPSYVNAIWGGTTGGGTTDTTAPSTPTSLTSTAKTTTSVTLAWNASTDNVGVTGYNVYVNGVLRTTVTTLNTVVSSLTAATSYTFTVRARDAVGNLSATSNALTVVTNSNSTSTELMFSEYIEGSSNNKALEIANKTSAAINLSAYSIRRQTNGAGAWSAGLALSGTISSGGKYTIVNSLMASSCYPTGSANLSTSATEMTFNGNDAVGLFKNGVLIDIIGTFNGGTANFSIDETIRRKATVTAPSTTFNKATQWDVFALDTCSNLGSRTTSKTPKNSINTATNTVEIYPNPSRGTFSVTNANTIYSIEVYSILGQKTYSLENTTQSEITIPNSTPGTYLVRLQIDSNEIVKKLIIQ
ncbi:endonuclease [Flavobacterium sp. FPG59]|uniref:endonuclease n=1 Tax=Flavobacterium sp. FPG59 TaxID=1929267 RepID=UPI000A3CC72C|nr:endonuclease [Flavobacterium sp. FPG59]OUD36338.1 endonuclease I [Flavobacterium sp. FPG59]